jgi:hypothetical protein
LFFERRRTGEIDLFLGLNEPGTQFDPPEAERLCDPAHEAVIEWQIALSSAV